MPGSHQPGNMFDMDDYILNLGFSRISKKISVKIDAYNATSPGDLNNLGIGKIPGIGAYGTTV